MLWILSGVVLVGLWVAGPTVGTFFRPAFTPTRRSDASVFQAQQSSHP